MNLPPRFLTRAAWALAIAGCALAVPGIAWAARCAPGQINLPRKANTLQVELGRAHPECTNPNTTHAALALDACAPPMPLSPYIFGPKGRGKVQLKKVSGPDLRVKIRLRHVQDSGGNPATAAFQTLLRLRITDDNCPSPAACTVEDFGVTVPTPCVNGKCEAKTLLLQDILGRVFNGGPCMIAIPEILVLDDTGAAFAVPAIAIGGPAAGPHNVPRRAKRLKYDLGRAFAECTDPNATHTPLALDACGPPMPLSPYTFGRKGKGKVQLKKTRAPPPLTGRSPGEQDDVQIKLKLRDVRDAFDNPANAPFKIELVLRITDNGCAGGPCTLEDFSVFVPTLCTNGKCEAKTTLNTESPGVVGSTVGPSMIAIPEIRILDDTGAAFAAPGITR